MDNEELERRAKMVREEFSGVIPFHVIFYERSMLYSIDKCLHAFNRYDASLSNNGNANELINSIQEAIGHAAALSRYFWPSKSGKNNIREQRELRIARGEYLRSRFNITDDSPLHNRAIRNAWEHFDERLDTYVLTKDTGTFFTEPLIGRHEILDQHPEVMLFQPSGEIFKLIDPASECLVLLGEKYFFRPIRNEVERIYNEYFENVSSKEEIERIYNEHL